MIQSEMVGIICRGEREMICRGLTWKLVWVWICELQVPQVQSLGARAFRVLSFYFVLEDP